MHAYHQEHVNFGPPLFCNVFLCIKSDRKVGREYLRIKVCALEYHRILELLKTDCTILGV